ncbi:hypothetical protein [Lihuaxuella thermophila]|uniref:hypothetical protein n=1 Tax=Lihuaxuella thermophila TaxID=1173111 RepID=UPI0011137DEC|nr:hypothetical protein [Lihuaxuella thermophila]
MSVKKFTKIPPMTGMIANQATANSTPLADHQETLAVQQVDKELDVHPSNHGTHFSDIDF